MLAKLIQQNEDLTAMVVLAERDTRFVVSSSCPIRTDIHPELDWHPTTLVDLFRSSDHSSEAVQEPAQSTQSSSSEQKSPRHHKRSGASVKFSDVEIEASSQESDTTPRKLEPNLGKQQQELTTWGMSLPEIDWTDEDELVRLFHFECSCCVLSVCFNQRLVYL